jgi:hypothetical protein
MTDLNEFIKWQAENPNGNVTIKINNGFGTEDKQQISIWVYDHVIMAGQYVNEVSEINLKAVKEEEERKTLKKLQEKYGG